MSNGNIELNHRPLKLGFLVKPLSKSDLNSAIQMNTYIWGGIFNPFIPKILKIPNNWKDLSVKYTAKQICKGYIEAFDPDLLISGENETKPYEEEVYRANIHKGDFWKHSENEQLPKIGIGIYEIAEHICRSELKYLRHDPYTFRFPKYSNEYSLFFDAVFGSLPKLICAQFRQYFDRVIQVEYSDCTISNYHEFLESHNLFLARIAQFGIRIGKRVRCADLVFLLDAKSPGDIFDYWNFRALGLNIIPLPIQSLKEPSVIGFAADFVKKSFHPSTLNAHFIYKATIQKSRSISEENFKEFENQLSECMPKKAGEDPKYFKQSWFPRIWDEGDYGEGGCSTFEYKKEEINLSQISDKINFTIPHLKVMRKYGNYGEPRYATDIDYRFHNTEKLYSEALPRLKRSFAHELGAHDVQNWRISKGGLVHLCHHVDWQVNFNLPIAENIFRQWMSEHGWGTGLSVPGKIGHQMIKYLGGIWGIGLLMNEGLIQMLSDMSEDRHKTAKEVLGVAAKIINEKRSGKGNFEKYIDRLIQCKALSLGVEIQCTMCAQRSWFSITSFDYELRCPKCLSNFQPPLANPKNIKWAYKATGPFNLPKQAQGLYAVLLSLRFFSLCLDFSTTPMLSFNAKRNDVNIEADLGLLFRELGDKERNIQPSVLFAECKTFNCFLKKDVERMRIIADNFPGSVIVFATLRRSLEKNEIRLIRGLAARGRKLLKNFRPRNPIIILTGDQLFDTFWPPLNWRDKCEPFASIHLKYSMHKIENIFDVTQQLFLNMEPWGEYQQKQIEKCLKKRKLKIGKKNDLGTLPITESQI